MAASASNDPPQICILSWNPADMPIDATCMVVGKRHAGKTCLMNDIMFHMRDRLDLVVGFSATEESNHNLSFFLPSAFVFPRYDAEKIKHVMEWQRRSVANNKSMNVGIIMDDCMGEVTSDGKKKRVMNSGDIAAIFKIGRHRKIFYWNALQYIKDAPPDARQNTDLLFMYNTPSINERQKAYKDFFGMFRTYNDFSRVLDACTSGYDCLVLDTRKAVRDPSACIYYYSAKLRSEPFRVGRAIFWKLSDACYVDRSDNELSVTKVLGNDPCEVAAVSAASARKGKVDLIVRKIEKVDEESDY
jgi:hypothetical protein